MRRLSSSFFVSLFGLALILSTGACFDFSCGPSGCSLGIGGAPAPTAPPNPIINVVPNGADFDNQTIGATTPCFVTHTSHLGTWLVTYQNAPNSPSTENRYFYFNKQNQGGTVGVYDTTGPNWKTYAEAAVGAWSSALNDPNNLVNQNSYYAFSPALSTDPNSPIQMSEVTTLPPNVPGLTSGAVDPNNWNYIYDMHVSFNSTTVPATYDSRYAVALHELGHAQGLAHNPDIGSIMFPQVDDGDTIPAGCFTYSPNNPTPPKSHYDTDALENHYDPSFIAKGGGSGCGTRGPCPLAQRRALAGKTSGSIYPLGMTAGQAHALVEMTSTHATRRMYAGFAAKRGIRDDGELRVIYDDPYFARLATMDDLIANSSLVVVGTVGPGRILNQSQNDLDVLRTVRISQVLTSQGPDAAVAEGAQIQVTEDELANGDYINDPSLKEGSRVLLFLTHATDNYHKRVASNIYRTTYQYGAKWLIEPNGTITQMGTARTASFRALDGLPIGRAFAAARTDVLMPAAVRRAQGQILLTSVLARRGETDARATAARARLLSTHPEELVKQTNRKAGRPGWIL